MITAAQASRIAAAFVTSFLQGGTCIGSCFGDYLAEGRGAPIDFTRVRAGPVYFAETPYTPVADTIPMPTRRLVGSWYVVHLLVGTTPIGSLGVAAHNTDVSIENGQIRLPVFGGNHISLGVIPIGTSDFKPIPPEIAVQRIGTELGARTTKIPELAGPGRPFSPVGASWKLTLDASVTLRRTDTGEMVVADVLYVRGADYYVPLPTQPSRDTITYVTDVQTVSTARLELVLRTGYPTRFVRVIR